MAMFSAKLISDIKKELNKISFNINGEFDVLKVKDDFALISFETENACYLIEYYEDGKDIINVDAISQLENNGINIGIEGIGDRIIIYKDFVNSGFYRYINDKDFEDEIVVRKLARWYKNIHSIKGESLADYYVFFDMAVIREMMVKLRVENNVFLRYVIKNFDNIKLKLERLSKCFVYGKNVIENLVVSKEKGALFVERVINFSKGNRAVDIAFVLSEINDCMRSVFMEEYGTVSEEEFLINDVVGCVIALCKASKESFFPSWAKDYLSLINDEELFKKVKTLVEWF